MSFSNKFLLILGVTFVLTGCQEEMAKHNVRQQIDEAVRIASATYEVPESYIHAIIHVETRHTNPPLPKGYVIARGVMGITLHVCRRNGCSDPFDINQNVMAGTRLLRDLLNHERVQGDFLMAAAAYHAGIQHIPQGARYATRVAAAHNQYN